MRGLAASLKACAAALAAALLLVPAPALAQRAPDLTLTGAMTGADHETYREVPFQVAAGVSRITVEFEYTGKDQRSVIDLGLRDPQRFRGWSGGNKSRFTVSDADATPSYLPGPLPAGTWKLVLGVPNLRKDGRADYTARIFFERGPVFAGFSATPVKTGPGWYRGDLHMHTGHSDGSCPSRRGVRVPCPVFKTLETAVARGLDFIAVTDHNTASHNGALRELAPYYDDLLLIPGREITTFHGHANVFGPTAFLDFQLGSPHAPDMATIQRQVEAAGGVLSINHPGSPSGEACMGCGWTAPGTDFSRVQAVEAVNGGSLRLPRGPEGPLSGIPFWEAQLNAGFRIAGVGGSDNHDASLDPAKGSGLGLPTTVVHAAELSQPAVLAALRAGHVFVDLTGSRDKLLEVTATQGAAAAEMGDALPAPAGSTVRLRVHVAAAPGGVISLAGDAASLARLPDPQLAGPDEVRTFDLAADGARRWLRVDVRGPDGRLWLLGNPIYLNATPPRP
jgi:hypothetical protein